MKNLEHVERLAVQYRAVDILKPDPCNARTHSKKQIEQIKGSVSEFGFSSPILVDCENCIIAGHGRLRAAVELKMDEVPTITLAGLSKTQKRALMLADNKIAMNAGWDLDLLKSELLDFSIQDIDFDITLTCFSIGEVDVIIGDPLSPDDEVVPAVPIKPIAKVGDIWELGPHRIGCGDGKDLSFLREVVGSEKMVDAAFLDPPYNVRINGHANAKGRHREFAMASGEMTSNEFKQFLSSTLSNCAAVSRSGAVHFICMDWRHMDELSQACEPIYDELLNIYVWNKSNAGMGSLYRSKHELVCVYRIGSEQHLNNVELGKYGRNRTNVWDYASVNSLVGSRKDDLALHPTVKPTAMVADAIKDVTKHGDIVLDIFLGSGTTLIAAEQTKRVFREVELDPAYVDVAIDRWRAMTNLNPKLLIRAKQ